jgi:hypothetical protein
MDSEELGLEDAPPVCVSEGVCVRDIELLTVTDTSVVVGLVETVLELVREVERVRVELTEGEGGTPIVPAKL